MSLEAFYTYQEGQLEEVSSDVLKQISNPSAIYTRSRRMVINPTNENFSVEDHEAITRGLRLILTGKIL